MSWFNAKAQDIIVDINLDSCQEVKLWLFHEDESYVIKHTHTGTAFAVLQSEWQISLHISRRIPNASYWKNFFYFDFTEVCFEGHSSR